MDDVRAEVREFLVSRRAKISPEQAGVVDYGGRRRVPGLRREEVARLARVSPEHYARIEKGGLGAASDSVIEAIATALQLDAAERRHLLDLALAARGGARRSRRQPPQQQVRAAVLRLLESMSTQAAFVWNGKLDVLALNQLGRALWAPMLDDPARPANLVRFAFLNPAARDFYPNWPDAARGAVALLRIEAGRAPHDPQLRALVGELATCSEEFRAWWASHDVRQHITGRKQLRHPVVGDLQLAFEALELPADPGLTITAYSAEPGSAEEEKLQLLASWAATQEAPRSTSAPDRA